MSRRTRQQCSMPLFQIEILDFSRKNGHNHYGFDGIERAPRRTLCKRFRDSKCALRWAKRIGSVISCQKVDTTPYLKNIEYLNLRQEPLEVTIDKLEFELGKDFVITKGGLTIGEVVDR